MSETQGKSKLTKADECISSLTEAERMVLARKAGEHLDPKIQDKDKYTAARRVAEALTSDLCKQVRETLAFELRKYTRLPKTIIAKIACDVDEIAVPFLRVTPALSDSLMAELVPLLSDNAHLALAVRSDLGVKASRMLISHANDNAALTVISNPSVTVDETLAALVLDHFSGNTCVIEALVKRPSLPLSVVSAILHHVGEQLKHQLSTHYGVDASTAHHVTLNSLHETIWRQIRNAAPGQVHAHVLDLKQHGKLTPDLMIAMAERGCLAFLESSLATLSGRPVVEIREILHLANRKQFHELMVACAMAYYHADQIHTLARRLYGAQRGRRQVGNPALWQGRPATNARPKSAA